MPIPQHTGVPVRPTQIYVSWQLFKALGYVAKKTGGTREDAAEAVLRAFVFREHSGILEWLEKREQEEKEFVKTLKSVQPKEPQ